MTLNNGYVLNHRYRVDALLGQGISGNVYRAWDLNLNMAVALKENLDTTSQAIQQFALEARQLANLRHEGLPYVIDHFSLPGQGQYLVMEYIEGQDLQSLLERTSRGLAETQVLTWFSQVFDALAFLHAQSPPIMHRDIKPANIKIMPDGRVVLVDFGAARYFGPGSRTAAVASPMEQGFAPPEQLEGGFTDARSDIYALGGTLFAALTGRPPPDSLQRKMGMALPSLRQLNPAISPRTEQVVLRAMELSPSRRFQSVVEFRDAIDLMRGAQIPPTQVVGTPTLQVSPMWPSGPSIDSDLVSAPAEQSRRWVTVAVIAIAALCLLGGLAAGVGLVWFLSSPMQAALTPDLTATSMAVVQQFTSPTIPVLPSPTLTLVPTAELSPTPTLTPFPTSTLAPTLAMTASPSPSQTVNPQATWQPCPGTYPSRLRVGMHAFVSYDPPLPNRVRSEPGTMGTIIGTLQVGEQMEILEGPVCSNLWIWWKVRSLATGLTGWTAEGDDKAYWLVPMP